jgi:de-etiolated-1
MHRSFESREQFRRTLHAVRTARNGGIEQSVKRGLSALPITAQSYRLSPYFDPVLFSYDEKCISQTDRLKACSDVPTKFYSQATIKVVFSVRSGSPNPDRSVNRPKRLASYIFHPSLPFAVSVQHVFVNNSAASSVVNIHYHA